MPGEAWWREMRMEELMVSKVVLRSRRMRMDRMVSREEYVICDL